MPTLNQLGGGGGNTLGTIGSNYLGVFGPRAVTGPARGSPAGPPMQAGVLPMLALTRERIARELEDNPQLARVLDINTTAEVGSNPDARRKYQASVIDRAVQLGQPLANVVNAPNYYPTSARAAARASGYQVDPALFEGANPANFATGNASFDPRTGRWVGFGGGPQTTTSGRGFGTELYGIENYPGWQEYARIVGYTGPTRTAIGPTGPSGGVPDTTPLGWQETVGASPSGVGYVPEQKVARGAVTSPEDLKPQEGGTSFLRRFLGALDFTPARAAQVGAIPGPQYSAAFRLTPVGKSVRGF